MVKHHDMNYSRLTALEALVDRGCITPDDLHSVGKRSSTYRELEATGFAVFRYQPEPRWEPTPNGRDRIRALRENRKAFAKNGTRPGRKPVAPEASAPAPVLALPPPEVTPRNLPEQTADSMLLALDELTRMVDDFSQTIKPLTDRRA